MGPADRGARHAGFGDDGRERSESKVQRGKGEAVTRVNPE